MQLRISVATEGPTDAAVARVLLRACGLDVGAEHGGMGKDRLDQRLPGYNRAASFAPWVVLRDLDQDAPCAPVLVTRLLPRPASRMVFRVAVRKVEAWLLADHEGMSRFLGVPPASFPSSPDSRIDPKHDLVGLARKGRRELRADMAPRPGHVVKVGPAYTSRLIEFAERHWNPERAAKRSDSLRRCLVALRRLR